MYKIVLFFLVFFVSACKLNTNIESVINNSEPSNTLESFKPSGILFSYSEFSVTQSPSISFDDPTEDVLRKISHFEAELRLASDDSIVLPWSAITNNGKITGLSLINSESYYVNLRAVSRNGDVSRVEKSTNFWAYKNESVYDVKNPTSIVVNSSEDLIYVLDWGSLSIFKINLTSDLVSLVSNEITGSGPTFSMPQDMVLNSSEDKIFVIDYGIGGVIEVDLTTGNRKLVSDGTGPNFSLPVSLKLNSAGNGVYVVDKSLDAVFYVDLSNGNRIIVSDSSAGAGIDLEEPHSLVLDEDANIIYVGNRYDFKGIIAVNTVNGNRSVVSNNSVGTGTGVSSVNLYLNNDKDKIFSVGDVITEIDIATGNRSIKTSGLTGAIPVVRGTVNSTENQVYIVDEFARVLKTELGSSNLNELYKNDFRGTGAKLSPLSIALNSEETILYSLDGGQAISRIDLLSGDRNILSDSAHGSGPDIINASNISLHESSGKIYVVSEFERNVMSVDIVTGDRAIVSDDGVGSGPSLMMPVDIAIYPNGTEAIVLDSMTNKLMKINLVSGNRSEIVGNITGAMMPSSLLVNFKESHAFVFSGNNATLLKVNLVTGDSEVISSDSVGGGPTISSPLGGNMSLSPNGLKVYIALAPALPGRIISVDLESGNREQMYHLGSPQDIIISNIKPIAYSSDLSQNSVRIHLLNDFKKTSLLSRFLP